MKSIVLLCSLISASAWASSYKLDDADILGKYVLHKTDKKSEIQWAEVKFNNDNKLVVITNRDDNEYELTGPTKDDLVYEGTDEPNCDGDEEVCSYDSETKVWLSKVKGAPQLTIDITTDNAWDESGKSAETTEWVLDWDKEIPDAIPFYTNMKNPKPVEAMFQACSKAIKAEVGNAVMVASDVCSRIRSIKYRGEFDHAFNVFLEDYVGKNAAKDVKEISDKKLQEVFAAQISELNKIPKNNFKKLSREDLVKEAKKMQKYISSHSDNLFVSYGSGSTKLFSTNEKAKIVVVYTIDVKL